MMSDHYKLILDKYFLEIYDSRFRQYIIFDEEYIINLQDRLPRTSVSTLIGRLIKQQVVTHNITRHYLSVDRKRKRTSSFSLQNDHLIIWLDSYIGHSAYSRHLKHKFHVTTMLDIARSMLDYDLCIDDLIQTNSKIQNTRNYLNIFYNKDECLEFLQGVESTIKILFITSDNFSEEIVPIIIKRVHMIYILVYNTLFFYQWAYDYKSSLLIFNNDLCLLVRLIRDIAQNFIDKAELISKSSVQQGIILLKWAKKLYNRANELDRPPYYLRTMNFIDHQLEILEKRCISIDPDEHNVTGKDDKFALECDEG